MNSEENNKIKDIVKFNMKIPCTYKGSTNYDARLSSKGLICYDFQEEPKCRITAIEMETNYDL